MSARMIGLGVAAVVALGAACGDDDGGGRDAGPPDAAPTFESCEAGTEAFVRNAFVAALGRRPYSRDETRVYVELIEQAAPLQGEVEARKTALFALMDDQAYVERWSSYFMDALRVARIEDQSQQSCYGEPARDSDDAQLAAHVRDTPATGGGDGRGAFTLYDLLRSALALDDISPVYRAHLFALVSRPIPAANVPDVEAELARREDFGDVFDAAYLNRDLVCLGCHNSEFSVTYSEDPAGNRHWAPPGLFEKALYGVSSGIEPARAHAVFRYAGFAAEVQFGEEGPDKPWGWDPACGSFRRNGLGTDPAGVDGRFGDIAGDRVTVYDLEASLARGLDALVQSGLPLGEGNEVSDADAAFAYLVATAIAEGVWRELIGTPLTIANYFPRNRAQQEMLQRLTEQLIDSGYSVRALVAEIVTSEYFNRAAPEAGCGPSPYAGPAIYDPWVIGDADESRRGNGAGDAVSALSSRVLLAAAYQALEWAAPRTQSFPQASQCEEFGCDELDGFCQMGFCCSTYDLLCQNPIENEPTAAQEQRFQRAVGVFHKNAERGFRGLDFQARLVWEDRFGACEKLDPSADDFIDRTAAAARADDATLADAIAALKDRVIGDPRIADEPVGDATVSERQALERIFDASLDAPAAAVADLESRLRRLCGVLLSTPQFLLGGLTAPAGAPVPRLTPESAQFDTVCRTLAGRTLRGGLELTCPGDGTLVVADPSAPPPSGEGGD